MGNQCSFAHNQVTPAPGNKKKDKIITRSSATNKNCRSCFYRQKSNDKFFIVTFFVPWLALIFELLSIFCCLSLRVYI